MICRKVGSEWVRLRKVVRLVLVMIGMFMNEVFCRVLCRCGSSGFSCCVL